jgi:hypothetical protein
MIRALLLTVLLLGACEPARRWEDTLAYGVWESPGGLRVHVRRDGSYQVCLRGSCETGVAKIVFGESGANLADFANKAPVRAYGLKLWSTNTDPTYQIAMGKIPASYEARICRDKPCVLLGSIEDLQPDALYKIADE